MTVPSRRTSILALAVTAILTVAAPAFATAGPPSAWTHDGFDAGNSGYNPGEAVVNARTVGHLTQRWSSTPAPGAEGCSPALPPPLVADGRVYVLDGNGVTALDAATGHRLWHDPDVFAGLDLRHLVLTGGLLVVAGTSCYANSDPDGYVLALDAATGAHRWNVTQDPPINALVADAGTVVTSGWATATNEDTVIAYTSGNGNQRWRRDRTTLAGEVSSSGRLLLHDAAGTTAVSAAEGAVLWRTRTRWTPLAATFGAFLAVPDPVGQGDQQGLASLRAGTGRIAWRRPASVESVAVDGRRVYAVTGRSVTAFRTADGSPLWTRPLPGTAGRPVRAGGLLYVTVAAHPLAILSPASGADVPGAARLPGVTGHAVVSAGRLYTTDGTTLRAYTP